MKNPINEMGLYSSMVKRKEGYVGMLLGIVNCTIIFIITITIGGRVILWVPQNSLLTVSWIVIFIIVNFVEEILRICDNIYFIMIVTSVIFGLTHTSNPDVTFLSIVNIIIIGILLSYMFIKSSNICTYIGYHFTWNVFIYGIPVSGFQVPEIITTQITNSNLLNGGMFGIESGVLTIFINILSFIFVWYYYRDYKYDFINNKVNVYNNKN